MKTAAVLVTAPVLVPLATALVAVILGHRPVAQRAVGLAGMATLLACTMALLAEVMATGTVRTSFGSWPAPFGIEFVADALGATMAVITAIMGTVTLVFRLSDADPGPSSPAELPLVLAVVAGVGGAFITGDLFNLYVWFELMLVGGLGLLAHGGAARHLEATFKYFVLNAIGTLLFLVSVAYLYAITGHLSYQGLGRAALEHEALGLMPFVVALVLAFLVKSGAFPVFAWLPASYHTLPAPILALFAALLTKVGVYAVLRLLGGIFVTTPQVVYEGLGWIAGATMLVGVLGAAYHWDMRRILAFHIISQIGYMLLGISLASEEGQTGTVFYIVHHIIVKANLFLIAGIVYRLTGSYDLRRCGGLYAARPLLAMLFLVPASSLVGIPPLSGFWAKLIVVRETLLQGQLVLAVLALLVGLLTLYSMTKIWFEAFWKKHPSDGWVPDVSVRLTPAYLATGALAVLTLTIGLAPETLLRLARAAAAGLVEVP